MNYTYINLKNLRMENNRAFRLLALSIVLFVALLGFAPSASLAQGEFYQQPTTVELEEFRQDLDRITQELYQIRETLRQNKVVREALEKNPKFKSAPALAKLRQQFQQMSYEDLAAMHKAFTTQFPEWREKSQELGEIVNKTGTPGDKPATVAKAGIADNCQDAFNAAPSWTDWSIARAVEIAADGAQNVIPPPFNAIATAAYIAAGETALSFETLNNIYDRCQGDQDVADIKTSISNVQTSVDNLQNAQTDIINTVNAGTTTVTNAITGAKTEIVNNDNSNRTAIVNNDNTNKDTIVTNLNNKTTQIITNDNSNKDTIVSNDNANRTAIVNNDNANKTAIMNNDNSNKDTIINNDNSNRTAIIANANQNKADLSNMLLRTQIEMDLRAENVAVVAWFMTPTANGGHLDFVQQIVTETLANLRAANRASGIFDISLEHGQRFLEKANAEKTAGKFRLAYDNYRRAYQAVVNQNIRVP